MKNAHTQFRAFALLMLFAFVAIVAIPVVAQTTSDPVAIMIGLTVATAAVAPFTSLASNVLCAHFELLSFNATAPGSSGAAAAALSGDTMIVKGQANAKIVAWWADHQTAGFQQLSFPSGHDTTRGYRVRVRASEVDQLIPEGLGFTVQPQETLSVTIAGSATAGDVESGSFLMLYPSSVAGAQRGLSWAGLVRDMEKLTTVDFSLTGAAAGYTGEEAINADSDLLLANRDYAILGGSVDVETATIYIKGPDTGNVKVGFPANELEPEVGNNFFPRFARALGLSLIPVFNSGNKANTFVGMVQDENNVTVKCSLTLALLKQ